MILFDAGADSRSHRRRHLHMHRVREQTTRCEGGVSGGKPLGLRALRRVFLGREVDRQRLVGQAREDLERRDGRGGEHSRVFCGGWGMRALFVGSCLRRGWVGGCAR